MSRIVVHEFITLDGVVQSPGSPDEDRDGGFEHGGWIAGYDLEDTIEEWESKTEALLLGRKTYEIWAGAWGVWDESAPGLQGELTRRYNRVPKYVASHSLSTVDWQNSRLLDSDVPEAVAELRTDEGGEIRIWGSTELVRSLAEHDLIDEYRLAVVPLVLGSGKKLFTDGFALTRFDLTGSRALSSGVVINTYRRTTAG